jgi:DNA-binding transcriptional LysR family regulator
MVDLNHIALFAKVVEAGSFSRAARTLGMPKATVSRQIAQLEASLEARLLHRTTRKVELTTIGRGYYEEAKRGLSSLQTAREKIAATRSDPRGTLRITAPVAFGAHYLIGWIGEFLSKFEQIRIELKLTDRPVDPIEERADLSFRTDRLPNSSLIARKLNTTRLILVASPTYLSKRGVPRRIEDLGRHDCIIFGPSLDTEVWRLKGPKGWQSIPVSGRIAVEGSHAELLSALAGLGIALLPIALTAGHLRNNELRHVLQDYGVDGGTLHAVYPSNRHMSAALRAFLDFAAAKAGEQPSRTV